jgi:hypothetical protein
MSDMSSMVPLDDKTLARARVCPRCEAPATPAKSVQSCVHCKKPFVLVAGARSDKSVVPNVAPGAKTLKMKYADIALRHAAIVDDKGIGHAELDPVTGHIPMGTRTIAFGDVVTLGVYRRVAWGTLIASVLLYLLPVVLPLFYFSFAEAPLLLTLAVPALALWVLAVRKAAVIGVQRMRVVGARPEDVLVFRFDTPMWRRKKFLAAVVERTGVGELPWT